MSGDILIDLLLNFVDNLNSTQNPIYLQAPERIIGSQIRKKIDKIKKFYYSKMQELKQQSQSNGKILFDEVEFDLKNRELYQQILIMLDEELRGIPNNSELLNLKKETTSRIQNDYEVLVAQNYEESREFCSELMTNYLDIFKEECANLEEMIKSKDIYIKEKSGQFEEIVKGYLDDAKGPYKYKTISDNIPALLFEIFDQWFESINQHYMSEINKNKANLYQTQDNLRNLQLRFEESENKRFDVENENQSLFYDRESYKREVDKLLKFKELQEEVANSRIQEYKRKYEKEKEKKKNYKEKYEQASKEAHQLSIDMQAKKKELASYLIKIESLDQALDQTIQRNQKRNSIESVGSLQEELFALMKQFRENINQAEDQIKRQRESVMGDCSRQSSDRSSKRMYEYQQLIDNHKKKNKQLKDKIQKLQEDKDDLEKQNNELEKEIIDLRNKVQYMGQPGDYQKIKDLNVLKIQIAQEYIQQEELSKEQKEIYNKYSQDSENFMKVLFQHKQEIELKNNEVYEMSSKYYEASIKISELNFQKENLVTVLRESIKKCQKRDNTLKAVLKSLPVDIQEEIKDIIKQSGLKLE